MKKGPTPSNINERKFRSLGFLDVLFLIQTVQVGIGLFDLPRVIVEEAGHPGWISIIIAGTLAQLAVWMIVLVTRRFPEQDLYEIFTRLFGTWVGRVCGGLFALYCLTIATVVCRAYIEVVQLWLFPTTSTNVFYILLLLPCYYAATAGARVLGRFGIATFLATVWMMFLLIVPARMITPEYYLPLFDTTAVGLLRATWKVSISAVGFELLLVYHVFTKKKEKNMLAASLGIWLTTTIYLLVSIIAIGFYSPGQIMKVISPTLHMFQVVELPMIERIEHIGISTWSFLVVSTVATYLWAAGRFLYSFGKWSEPRCVLATLPLVLVMGIWSQDTLLITKIETILGTTGGIVSILLPALLLLASIILRKRGSASPPAEDTPEVNAS
ncbi:GerAB/ArcD/ProY family transporter [Tumebacillus permanentifrigoris]|uniref:Spore germination protein (Amino acid permease) n=1 Tax=Tumebacillus permanentifrigoris TaxID=378543 RepID=A0A316DEZ0_9BACL|nr:GerAB/ArcD/ProY family transporter [Tumebacillus permanentifrigoris]PWK16296.1 spore germination protein (amino acid permease) [Tumebacillus permanentifrigoris]